MAYTPIKYHEKLVCILFFGFETDAAVRRIWQFFFWKRTLQTGNTTSKLLLIENGFCKFYCILASTRIVPSVLFRSAFRVWKTPHIIFARPTWLKVACLPYLLFSAVQVRKKIATAALAGLHYKPLARKKPSLGMKKKEDGQAMLYYFDHQASTKRGTGEEKPILLIYFRPRLVKKASTTQFFLCPVRDRYCVVHIFQKSANAVIKITSKNTIKERDVFYRKAGNSVPLQGWSCPASL